MEEENEKKGGGPGSDGGGSGGGGNKGSGVVEVREVFDTFVSSSQVGMRKPERRIYERALLELGKVAGREVRAEEVLFVDDIGSNLKAAKEMGFQTLRVVLGESRRSVEELEKYTGVKLLDGDERDNGVIAKAKI